MAFGKWIGAWLGWINSQSVLGGMAGFALGAFLCEIAKADGNVAEVEVTALRTVALNLRLDA